MPTFQIDYFGFKYDADVGPAFIEISDKLVYHRGDDKYYDYSDLTAQMAEEGYTAQTGEIGNDDAWLMEHLGAGPSTASGGSGGGGTAGISAAVVANDTSSASVTFSGAMTTDGTISTSGLAFGGTAADTTGTVVALSSGDDADAAAAAYAAAFDGTTYGSNTLNAAAVGPVVTLTEAGGAIIDSGLAVTVDATP